MLARNIPRQAKNLAVFQNTPLCLLRISISRSEASNYRSIHLISLLSNLIKRNYSISNTVITSDFKKEQILNKQKEDGSNNSYLQLMNNVVNLLESNKIIQDDEIPKVVNLIWKTFQKQSAKQKRMPKVFNCYYSDFKSFENSIVDFVMPLIDRITLNEVSVTNVIYFKLLQVLSYCNEDLKIMTIFENHITKNSQLKTDPNIVGFYLLELAKDEQTTISTLHRLYNGANKTAFIKYCLLSAYITIGEEVEAVKFFMSGKLDSKGITNGVYDQDYREMGLNDIFTKIGDYKLLLPIFHEHIISQDQIFGLSLKPSNMGKFLRNINENSNSGLDNDKKFQLITDLFLKYLEAYLRDTLNPIKINESLHLIMSTSFKNSYLNVIYECFFHCYPKKEKNDELALLKLFSVFETIKNGLGGHIIASYMVPSFFSNKWEDEAIYQKLVSFCIKFQLETSTPYYYSCVLKHYKNIKENDLDMISQLIDEYAKSYKYYYSEGVYKKYKFLPSEFYENVCGILLCHVNLNNNPERLELFLKVFKKYIVYGGNLKNLFKATTYINNFGPNYMFKYLNKKYFSQIHEESLPLKELEPNDDLLNRYLTMFQNMKHK